MYIPFMTSVDISSLFFITAADMPCLELCWHWLGIRLFNGEITIQMCLMLESGSKIKGGKKNHILVPNPVGKTPTSSIVFTTQRCWSFKSNSKLKLGLLFFSNIFFMNSAIFPMLVNYVTLLRYVFYNLNRVHVFRRDNKNKIKWKCV